MRTLRRIAPLLVLAGLTGLGGAGCRRDAATDFRVRGFRQEPPVVPAPPENTTPPRQDGSTTAPPPPREEPNLRGSNTKEGRALADRLMLLSEGLLADARVLDDKHLYVVLGSKAEARLVPDLVRALVVSMHNAFPDTNVVVHVRMPDRRHLLNATFDVSEGTITYQIPR